MSDIYLMVNGKRIELPEEAINEIKSGRVQKSHEQKLKEEFQGFLKYPSYAQKDCAITLDSPTVLKIEYPVANREWTYDLWKACMRFCEANLAHRYPIHKKEHNTEYLYISVEPGK